MLMVAVAAISYSCNAGNNETKESEENPAKAATEEATKVEHTDAAPKSENTAANPASGSAETKATADMCACMNASLKDVSPRVQQVFIRAGTSERPLDVLRNEVVAMSDKEQEELMVQLQRFSSDPELQNCSGKLLRKYGLDPDDRATQERILQAAKNNKDCELVQALIKIGMQQQTGTGN